MPPTLGPTPGLLRLPFPWDIPPRVSRTTEAEPPSSAALGQRVVLTRPPPRQPVSTAQHPRQGGQVGGWGCFRARALESWFVSVPSFRHRSCSHCLKQPVYCLLILQLAMGFSDSSVGKESACSAGDPGSIPGLGRSPGEGKGYPLQYSGLENSMDCIVHGDTKSQTRLSDFQTFFRLAIA